MKISHLALAVALVGAGMSATVSIAQSAAANSVAAQPSRPWAQAGSDIPADPAVRYGTLPNGMRYAIMHNEKPKGKASFRLRIDAGSLYEKDNQLGLAHFMEHMAFNGTTHVPKNDIIKNLERMGLAFGADLNAATGFDETYYSLDIPNTDEKTVGTALFMMREQVSEALMKQEDIDGERGVIKGEERLRNTPQLRASEKAVEIYARGQIIAKRWPIGDLKIINTAPRQAFVDFYNHYYRPSRATLIAVGDFDVDQMEVEIRKHFADWKPKATDGPNPDLGIVQPRSQEAHLIIEPGTQQTVSLGWIAPPDLRPDTSASRRERYMVRLALGALNQRLSDLSQKKDPPFAGAQASRDNLSRSVNVTSISAVVSGGKWQQSLQAIDQESRRLAEYGITDTELQRIIKETRPMLAQAIRTKGARASNVLAGIMVNAVNDESVFTSPEYDLQNLDDMTRGLTAADVNKVVKSIFVGSGPMVVLGSPDPIEGGEKALAAIYDGSKQVAVAAPVDVPDKAWAYTDFGVPGAVANREELPEFGATKLTFTNGVTLLFKHTDFDKSSVSIRVNFGTGNMNFSPNKPYLLPVAMNTLTQGGLGKLDANELGKAMVGHQVGGSFSITDRSFVLSGSTRSDDLTTEMQLLAAYLSDPAFRPEPYDAIKKMYPLLIESQKSTPGGVFGEKFAPLLAGGDQRKARASIEAVAASSLDPYRAQIKDMFAKGPLSVIITGDTTLDEAIRTTADTFGALPSRLPADPPVDGADQRRFPAPAAQIVTATHGGLAEQALGVVSWPTTDARDPAKSQALGLLVKVLRLRVLDEVREKLAIAYAPSVGGTESEVFKGYGYLQVQAETAPDKLPAFFAAVDRIAASLRDKPVGQDELNRARNPILASMRTVRDNNFYWAAMLDTASWSRSYADAVDKVVTPQELMKITPAGLQALAREYLVPGKAWKGQILPAPASGQRAATSAAR